VQGGGKADENYDNLRKGRVVAPKSYFNAAMVGYFLAIIVTSIVMLVFDHGQPALLYLVPAVLCSTLITAWR
jgi:hypothetical protein